MSERSKLNYLFHGLKPSLLEKDYPMKPKNCKAFLDVLKLHTEAVLMANRKGWSSSVLAAEQEQGTTNLTVASVVPEKPGPMTSSSDELLRMIKELVMSAD